jgi:hypothetical protein
MDRCGHHAYGYDQKILHHMKLSADGGESRIPDFNGYSLSVVNGNV